MIEVRYDGEFCLSVTGHSGQAEKGSDIVCAGASALAAALAEQLLRNGYWYRESKIQMGEGEAHIEVRPKSKYYFSCAAAYETAMCGYELLANKYSSYIRIIPM